jgi:hypothetical protein
VARKSGFRYGRGIGGHTRRHQELATPMDTSVDSQCAAPVGDITASPVERTERLDGWRRVMAWLGLGCIGAAHPGHDAKRCAPGCVRKPVKAKRRTKFIQQRLRAKPPKSAAGALARQPRQALERVELSVWPPRQ